MNIQNNASGGNYMIYQYDDKDRLRKAFAQRNHWMEWYYAPNLDFKYFYDVDDNIIEKQIPDAAAIYLKYNNRNQLVLSQDGKQRTLNQWLATQYDAFGRSSASGFATTTTLNTDDNPTLNTTLTTTDYSTTSGVTLGKPERTKNYHGIYLESFMQYDSYGRLNNSYSNNHLYSPGGAISATNFSEKVAITYDLADNVLTKTRTHKPNASTTHTILETTDYDNGLRLKRVKHQVDAMAEQIVSQMDYTVKNQVQTKWMGKVGAFNFLQKVDFEYNTLGWLTGINPQALTGVPWSLTNCVYPAGSTMSTTDLDYNDLFSMDLRYENPLQANAPTGTTVTPQYGGNISQITWQVRGREKQSYTFKYDHINRLTEARYADIANNGSIAASNRFDEVLSYDVRGNIKSLQRWGFNASCGWGQIDNLTYHYNTSGDLTYLPTNKLQKVVDASDLTKGFKTTNSGSYYTYDSDGNLTADPNKGITNIVYNHLNLPTTITFTNNRSIGFMYDAGGNKLRKTVVQNGVTQYIQDYIGGIEYRTASNVTSLEAIYHSEGRITTIGGTLKYEYALKDHLGNTRLMFCDKNSNGVLSQSNNQETTEVTQENSYYPFGLNMEGMWMNTPSVIDNKYTYNGKELNSDFGLEWSDYGARFYDAAVGRWWSVDPLAEKTKSWSIYVYAGNNPIKFIDPDGMTWKDPKEAAALDKKIDNRITDLNSQVAKNNTKLSDKNKPVSDKERKNMEKENKNLAGRISQLNTSKADIKKLGDDQNHVYDLVTTQGGEHHVTKGSDGVINIEGSSDALHIHEIRHVALSLDSPKGLTFNQYDQLMPTTITGLKDEISGYSAQHGYDPTSLPGVYPSTLEGINKEYIGNIKNDATGDYIYKSIRQLWLNEMKQNKINEKNKKNKN